MDKVIELTERLEKLKKLEGNYQRKQKENQVNLESAQDNYDQAKHILSETRRLKELQREGQHQVSQDDKTKISIEFDNN